ncbi:hypothetical protein ES703_94216 [subsurface metagenome]
MSGRRGKMSILLAIIVALALLTASCAVAPTPTPTPPAIPLALYENTEHGFSIKYPEGWTENERGIGTQFSLEFRDPEGRLTADVSVGYKTEDIALADLVSESKAYMEAAPQFEVFSEGDVTIGEGISGYEIVGKGDLGTGKVEKFRYVMLVREKQGFWVGARGEPTTFDQQEQLIDTTVNSFKLLSTYTFVPPTPTEGGTYTNAEHGFSISYPVGWMEAPSGRPDEVVSLSSAEGFPSVFIRAWTEETTLAEAASKLKKDISKHVSDYDLTSEGEMTLDDGTPAYEIVFSGTMEGYNLKCKYVIVIQEANVFLLQGFTMPALYEQHEAVLDEVIHSFHLE